MIKETISETDPNKSIQFLEWKECRSSISRFDDAILNLRKYGFSLITLLLGSQGLLYGNLLKDDKINNGAIIGIYFAIMILIIGLFRLDRMFHIFVRASVNRAKELETTLGISISKRISELTHDCKTATWGVSLYNSFCIANYLLVSGLFLSIQDWQKFIESIKLNRYLILILSLIFLLVLYFMYFYHKRSRNKAYSESVL